MAIVKSNYSEEDILEEIEDTLKDKYLTFIVGSECYGIELRFVIEIIGIQKITPLPDTNNFLKGIINLRGKVIPVLDARLSFKMPEKKYGDRTCIIVVEIGDSSFGLIVDTVAEVITIPEDLIDPAPQTGASVNHFIKGIGKSGDGVKILIDADKFLTQQEFESNQLFNKES